jgi:hypothetical protein
MNANAAPRTYFFCCDAELFFFFISWLDHLATAFQYIFERKHNSTQSHKDCPSNSFTREKIFFVNASPSTAEAP